MSYLNLNLKVETLRNKALENTRKRIRNAIQRDNHIRLMRCIIRDGFNCYERDRNVYKEN